MISFMLALIILILMPFQAIAQSRFSVNVQFSSNEAYYDVGLENQKRPDVYLKIFAGDKIIYKSKSPDKDSFYFRDVISIEAQDYTTIRIDILDDDVKSDDLIMSHKIIMLPESYVISTEETNVKESHGGLIEIAVSSDSALRAASKDDQMIQSIERSIESALREIEDSLRYKQSSFDKDLMRFNLESAQKCVNKLQPLYTSLYEAKLRSLFKGFPELLSFHIYDPTRSNGFIDWMNGWFSGYHQASLKVIDWVTDSKMLDDKIGEKYYELALSPTMAAYDLGIEKISGDLLNQYAIKCGALMVAEMSGINLDQAYLFNLVDSGLIHSVIGIASELIDLRGDIKGNVDGGLDVLKTGMDVLKNNNISASSLKSLKDGISTTKNLTKQAPSQGFGAFIGMKVGMAIQSKALAALATKGFMGKTAVFFFKASSSKIVTSIGLSKIASIVAVKAATAAGGKTLMMIAQKAVGAAVGTLTLGVSVLFDFFMSKGIAFLTTDSMRAEIVKQNESICDDIITNIVTSFKPMIGDVSELILSEKNPSISLVKR